MNNTKEVITDIIRKLSDKEFQINVWINNLYWDPILNFGEAVNTLDDYSFFERKELEKIFFTEKLISIDELIEFGERLERFEEPEDLSDLHKDLNWIEIMRKAEDIQMKINKPL